MSSTIQNQLGTVRRSRGVGAAELARLVGVSRQTIYAIEAGSYVPNTEVTLKLARVLEVRVEELFALGNDGPVAAQTIPVEVLSPAPVVKGQAMRLCSVNGRRVSIPVHAAPYYLPEADGVVAEARTDTAELVAFSRDDAQAKQIVMAGCDPAIGLISRMVEKLGGVEIVSAAASSKLALRWLKEGKVHIAGTHLEDPETGEFNLPYLRAEFSGVDYAVVSFAEWEEGLVIAPGNPKRIRKVEDLARKNVRFVNREAGSGSRQLLDRLLQKTGIESSKVEGYGRTGFGHLAVAYMVYTGDADCCLATRSAAQTFQLDFVPLQNERYDFVMERKTLDTPMAQTFLDILQRAQLRRKLEVLAGYDTSQTGKMLA